jgi:Aromatic-ring hydroxylase, C-terminal
VTEILGIEAGYRYVDSPIVWREPGDGPDPDNPSYVPTTWPGARLPHVWLSKGAALHDRLGPGYTLLRLGGTQADTSGLEQAFRKIRAPLDVLDISCERAREIYQFDLILVRPDLHVAWRGNKLPQDVSEIAMVATGHITSHI